MRKRLLSTFYIVILVLFISVKISVVAQASTKQTILDGSYLTHDDESIGYAQNITRGEDLLTGYSKCVRLSAGKIYAGGTTIAAHNVDQVKVAVIIERAKEGDTAWEFYDSWQKELADSDRVSSNRTLMVEGGYYYRVRSTHSANYDMSSSFTDGVYIESP